MSPPMGQDLLESRLPAQELVAQELPRGRLAGWKWEQRLQPSRSWQAFSVLLALLAAFAFAALLIALSRASIPIAFAALFQGAFGSSNAIVETLVQATPLIFTGLAVTVAFRGRIWNIGAEGQFFTGAMAAFWVSSLFAGLPGPALWLLIVLGGLLAGALWGGLAGFLKARYGASEIIVTVMQNFIIIYVLSFLLSGIWQDPASFYAQSAQIPAAADFPKLLPPGRLHLGLGLAVVSAVVVYLLLWKTTLGYEIRALGINPKAARYKGINLGQTTILVMALSGALAGLAGASEVAGLQYRLRLDISTGYGFAGIIIAMLGGLHPVGVLVAAIFFGALTNGSSSMQIAAGVPVAIVDALQGTTLILLLLAQVLATYRLRRGGAHG